MVSACGVMKSHRTNNEREWKENETGHPSSGVSYLSSVFVHVGGGLSTIFFPTILPKTFGTVVDVRRNQRIAWIQTATTSG